MLTAALFTVPMAWKPPKCLSIDEWIKKVWHILIYNGILFSLNKMKILLFATT